MYPKLLQAVNFKNEQNKKEKISIKHSRNSINLKEIESCVLKHEREKERQNEKERERERLID